MQSLKLALLGGAMLVSGVTFAAEPQHEHHHRRVWHCTAYAEGHGHNPHWSASATHRIQYVARRSAMERCERKTHHHCHHVDCHLHHH